MNTEDTDSKPIGSFTYQNKGRFRGRGRGERSFNPHYIKGDVQGR